MKYSSLKQATIDQMIAHFTCPECGQSVSYVVDYVHCNADEGCLYLGPRHEFELQCPKCKKFSDGHL